jgi:Mor family transcriptional regulator
MKLAWMKNMNDVERCLENDMKLVYENCGIDTVITLLENLPSIKLFVSRGSVADIRDLHEKKLYDEVKPLLGKDMQLVYEMCGIDTVTSLIENLPGINFYVSQDNVIRAQKKYIAREFNGRNVKELAIKIGCGESFIYKVVRQRLERPSNQSSLFEAVDNRS